MRAFDLPPSLTHTNRVYAVHCVRGSFFTHVLTIGQDRERDVYGLVEATDGFDHEYRTDRGELAVGCYFPPSCVAPRSFIVRKCGGEVDGLYLVTLGARPSCQCYGFNRWQNCKHIDALSDLVRRNGI